MHNKREGMPRYGMVWDCMVCMVRKVTQGMSWTKSKLISVNKFQLFLHYLCLLSAITMHWQRIIFYSYASIWLFLLSFACCSIHIPSDLWPVRWSGPSRLLSPSCDFVYQEHPLFACNIENMGRPGDKASAALRSFCHSAIYWNETCYAIVAGASRSKPHINHSYEKIAVPVYVCMYVCMWGVCSDTSSTWS